MKHRFLFGISAALLLGCRLPVFSADADAKAAAAQKFSDDAMTSLVRDVPEAKDFTLIYSFDPLSWPNERYKTDNGEKFSGKVTRIGYYLSLTDKQGNRTWAFAAMDPFTQDLIRMGVPELGVPVVQDYVTGLEVFSNVPGVKTGTFAKGNLEFWAFDYEGANVKKIPGANNSYDFGDKCSPAATGGYGSMQIHNFMEKQTVIAFNNFNRFGQRITDVGIGNAPKGSPDWTFSKNNGQFASGVMLVVAKFENRKEIPQVKVDNQLIKLGNSISKINFAPDEIMEFHFTLDFGKQTVPYSVYKLKWSRRGDDGKAENGFVDIAPDKPAVIRTSAKHGFVRVIASLCDARGRQVLQTIKGRQIPIRYDGGVGVDIFSIKPAVAEPADFDAFWAKQKAKLDAVPVKAAMKEISKPGAAVKVYEVSVDCAGPRPVTGYLTIPADAKEKSLPAQAVFQGYGTHFPSAPKSGHRDKILFYVNAHGLVLGKGRAYYEGVFKVINGKGGKYAFDPAEYADPENAYFCGMVLRVMRAFQFLKTLPQWNGKDLIASGGSQGGLQTIWAAAMEPQLTEAYPTVPWCCDLAGITIKRMRGWRPDYAPGINYFDIAFMAKRVKCKVSVVAGLGDYVCPPSGVMAMYNNLNCPKSLEFIQNTGHGVQRGEGHASTKIVGNELQEAKK